MLTADLAWRRAVLRLHDFCIPKYTLGSRTSAPRTLPTPKAKCREAGLGVVFRGVRICLTGSLLSRRACSPQDRTSCTFHAHMVRRSIFKRARAQLYDSYRYHSAHIFCSVSVGSHSSRKLGRRQCLALSLVQFCWLSPLGLVALCQGVD